MKYKNKFLPINRLALIGVGMIGGSFIWSLKKAGMVNHVIGVDVDINALRNAVELGIIDSKSSLDSLHDVDAIVIATPVGAIANIFSLLKDKDFINTALITDVGSTKQSVIKAVIKGLGFLPKNFIPSHPIAGREHIGVGHAEELMFHGYRTIITPNDGCCPKALDAVVKLWQSCGAFVDTMSAKEHDMILAATSHLPHVLAYSLMESLTTTEYETPIIDYAAGGFKSFTRTASSNPTMWRDICLNNKKDILYWLKNYRQTLENISKLIENEDSDAIIDIFKRSKLERDRYLLNNNKKASD